MCTCQRHWKLATSPSGLPAPQVTLKRGGKRHSRTSVMGRKLPSVSFYKTLFAHLFQLYRRRKTCAGQRLCTGFKCKICHVLNTEKKQKKNRGNDKEGKKEHKKWRKRLSGFSCYLLSAFSFHYVQLNKTLNKISLFS